MRLSPEIQTAIKKTTKLVYGDSPIWLFGSRVDMLKKGGDIDLFIQTKSEYTLQDKINFITSLQYLIGDRKIDLIVQTPSSKHRSIFDTAQNNGILL
jgi:predicted nucleotidyltransferase